MLSNELIRLEKDIHEGNILQSDNWILPAYEETLQIKPMRVYLIDFAVSCRFEQGPGFQRAVQLPDIHGPRPREGITQFDPYAWDVFRLGKCLDMWMDVSYNSRMPPSLLRRIRSTVSIYVGKKETATASTLVRSMGNWRRAGGLSRGH